MHTRNTRRMCMNVYVYVGGVYLCSGDHERKRPQQQKFDADTQFKRRSQLR